MRTVHAYYDKVRKRCNDKKNKKKNVKFEVKEGESSKSGKIILQSPEKRAKEVTGGH